MTAGRKRKRLQENCWGNYLKNTDSGDFFPGGPVAKTLHSQCREPGFDPWSGNWIPRAATKSLHEATKDLTPSNRDWRPCVLHLRLSTAKKKKYRFLVQRCNHTETDSLPISRDVKPISTVGPSHSMPAIYPGEKEKYMFIERPAHSVPSCFICNSKKNKKKPKTGNNPNVPTGEEIRKELQIHVTA